MDYKVVTREIEEEIVDLADGVEMAIDEADRLAEEIKKRLSHVEGFANTRKMLHNKIFDI